MNKTVTIIGAGLAGCEAAWILSQQGISPARIFPITEYTTFLRKRKRGSVSYPIQEKDSPFSFVLSCFCFAKKLQ